MCSAMLKHLDPTTAIDIPCPSCSKSFPKTIGDICNDPHIVCPECGQPFDASELKAGPEQADKDIDGLAGTLTLDI